MIFNIRIFQPGEDMQDRAWYITRGAFVMANAVGYEGLPNIDNWWVGFVDARNGKWGQ